GLLATMLSASLCAQSVEDICSGELEVFEQPPFESFDMNGDEHIEMSESSGCRSLHSLFIELDRAPGKPKVRWTAIMRLLPWSITQSRTALCRARMWLGRLAVFERPDYRHFKEDRPCQLPLLGFPTAPSSLLRAWRCSARRHWRAAARAKPSGTGTRSSRAAGASRRATPMMFSTMTSRSAGARCSGPVIGRPVSS